MIRRTDGSYGKTKESLLVKIWPYVFCGMVLLASWHFIKNPLMEAESSQLEQKVREVMPVDTLNKTVYKDSIYSAQ